MIFNIYVPYVDQQNYYDSLEKFSWFSNQEIILGGDLNFSIGAAKVWGP